MNLLASHLILKLALADAAIILECEQDIEPRELSRLFVVLPLLRLEYERMRVAPARKNINAELFKKGHEFGYGAIPRRPVFLLQWHIRVISDNNVSRTTSRCLSSVTYSSKISLRSDSTRACCQIGCCAKSLSAVANVV